MSALQRTPEWFRDRVGCLTASRASAVLKRGRDGKPLKAYTDLIEILMVERITGQPVGVGTTEAMQWGIDHEDDARIEYEMTTGRSVDQVAFIRHETIEHFGASPDGIIGDDGLLEIKCPNTLTHIRWLKAGTVPEEYKAQMLVQLLCTGRKWVDFFSFDPRLTGAYERLSRFCVRFEPSEEERADALANCVEFLKTVDAEMLKLSSL